MLHRLHRTIPCVMALCAAATSAACTGTIQDPHTYDDYGRPLGHGLPEDVYANYSGSPAIVWPIAGSGSGTAYPGAGNTGGAGATAAPNWNPGSTGAAGSGASTIPTSPVVPGSTSQEPDPAFNPAKPTANGTSIGMGDIDNPALGPAPSESVSGDPWVLVKNWDFGANGTVRNASDLTGEFQFHDHFGTIANGTNYSSVTVAPTAATAINAPNLGLPNNKQPVEDPSRPFRAFTTDSIKAYVLPLDPAATTVTGSKHDTGNGSMTAKWSLAKGGSRMQQDLLWESRVRIPKPEKAFWFSLWTAGKKWNKGAEMDVVESFGTPNIGAGAKAFHVNSVGGQDKYAYKSWPSELGGIGVPAQERDLADYHTFTWIYLRDDTYKVLYDGFTVQEGKIQWTYGGGAGDEAIDMWFLFDFGWGHTQVQEVNISMPASTLPIEYELDYSRVYFRK